jgi:hypothetical protein
MENINGTDYLWQKKSEDNIKVDFWQSNYGNVNFRQDCRPTPNHFMILDDTETMNSHQHVTQDYQFDSHVVLILHSQLTAAYNQSILYLWICKYY